MSEITVLKPPSKGKQNEVRERLQEAIDTDFDEVFIVGLKDGNLRTTYSGYKDIEQKLGVLELLKHNMIKGAGDD